MVNINAQYILHNRRTKHSLLQREENQKAVKFEVMREVKK